MRTEIRGRLRRSRDLSLAITEIEAEIEDVTDHEKRSEMLFEIASVTEEVIPERERAIAIYQRSWKLNQSNIKALTRARQVYGELGRAEMVAKVGTHELRLRDNDSELAAVVGLAFLDSAQRKKAVPLLSLALESNPEDVELNDAFLAASYDEDNWRADVERLTEEAKKAESDIASRLYLQAARIVHHEDPNSDLYRNLLHESVAKNPQGIPANELIEKLLSDNECWDELEEHHRSRIEAAVDVDKLAVAEQFALRWLARFHHRERAAKFFQIAIEQISQDNPGANSNAFASLVGAFSLVREIHSGNSEWSEVLELADIILSKVNDDRKVYVAVQAGLVAWKELNDVVRAQRYFAIVSDIERQNPNLTDFLSESGTISVENLSAKETHSDDFETLEESAIIANESGSKTSGSDAEGDPMDMDSDSEASEKSARISSESTSENIRDEVEDDPLDTDMDTSENLASVAREPIVDLQDEVLSDDLRAGLEAARASEAESADKGSDAWQKLIQAHPTARVARREYARVLRESKKWNALIQALKDEEQTLSNTDEQRIVLLRELIDVYKEVRNHVMIVNTYNEILKIEGNNSAVLDELALECERLKKWPDLVSTLQKKVLLIDDEIEKTALYLRIANLYIDQFSNQAEAIKAFERVLELDRDNEDAIRHLLAVYAKRRDWEKLISLREREIEKASPDERVEKIYEVAQLVATRVKKADVCTRWWEKVLAETPDHKEAIDELEKLYERSRNWAELAKICATKADGATSPQEQTGALQKLGLLYTDKIVDPEKAIEVWERLLAVDRSHRRAHDSLKKLYIAQGAWDELESLYRANGKIDEYVRVLERQVDSASHEIKLSLALKIAVMYRDEIGKADRATRAFERVLALDENNIDAAEALITLYERGRDPRKLVSVLEIQFAQTKDPELRQDRLQVIAEYAEEKLRDKGAAYGWWLKAHAEDRNSEVIRGQIERLAKETGGWAELISAYQTTLENSPNVTDTLPMLLVVSRVLEEELEDSTQALESNQKILAIDPSNEYAIEALERLYLGLGRFDDLLEIYQRKLKLATEPEQQKAIRHQLGRLYEEKIRDDAKAAETYQAILDSHGEDLPSLQALDRIFNHNEQWPQLADTIARELLVVSSRDDGDDFCELKLRLAVLREKHLQDSAGAIRAYREVLDLRPEHADARQGLEAYLESSEHRVAVGEILEPIYTRVLDWGKLIQVHEIAFEVSTDSVQRVELLTEIGRLHAEKRGDVDDAFGAYSRAFLENPGADSIRNTLEEVSQLVDGGGNKLVELFEGVIRRADLEPALAHELSMKVALAYDERLESTDNAVQYYRNALNFEPDDMLAIRALERIFTRDAQYPELLDVYRKMVEVVGETDEGVELLHRIASIHEEMLRSPQEAISTYREILSQDSENLRALRSLDRLYQEKEQWHELGDTISRQLILCEDDTLRVELLVRLAALRETKLGEVAAAIETYRQVIAIDDSNQPALDALERLIANVDYSFHIAQILEPIYRSRSERRKLIDVYEIMAQHALDPERKIELLHTIGELHELSGEDDDEAFETYGRALRDEPHNTMSRAQVERLGGAQNRWADVVALYDDITAVTPDEELRVQLLSRVAQIQEGELASNTGAVTTYQRILEISPDHVSAASSIVAIHERTADYPALVGALRAKIEILPDIQERKELLYRVGEIQTDILEDSNAAVMTYQSVLGLDDVDETALSALERLYINLERWTELKDIYMIRAGNADSIPEKKRMLYVLGQVYDRELEDTAKAIDVYQAILDIDGGEVPAIQALDRLYGQSSSWYDLLGNLESQVELAEYPEEIVGLKYRVGELWQRRLNDISRAIDTYSEALSIDPGHVETLAALDGLVFGDEGEPVMAAQILAPIYQASGETKKLVDVLDVLVRHSDDPPARVEILHQMAGFYEHDLNSHHEAFQAYVRALSENSGHEVTLSHLERLAPIVNAWEELGEVYLVEGEKSLDVPRQVALLNRLARIQEEELHNSDDAIPIYNRILEAEFDNRDALVALDRLYGANGDWVSMVGIIRKQIQLADTEEKILELQFRLGIVLEQELHDLPAAIEVYRDVLAIEANHAPTLSALEMLMDKGEYEVEVASILEPIYESAEQYEQLQRVHEVQLKKLRDTGERQRMLQRLAELAEHRLGDQSRAFAWWSGAIIEDASSELAFEEAERLAGQCGRWVDLAQVYSRVIEHSGQRISDKGVLSRLGRVFERELGDASRAIETYSAILDVDTHDADALESLDRLYESCGMHRELVDVLRKRIEITLDGDEIVALQLRSGQIYSDCLDDVDSALGCYEQILEHESRNRAALEAQEVIYFGHSDWNRLYTVYDKLVDIAEGDGAMAGLYARMALLASEGLAEDEAAIDLWGRVIDIRGDEPQALGALSDIFGRREMWDELIDAVERRVGVADVAQDQISLYKTLGKIWDQKLESPRRALDAWLLACDLDPSDPETLQELAWLYRRTEDWQELCQTLYRIIEVGQSAGTLSEDDLIALHSQVGQLQGELLGNVGDAVDAWRCVLALDPGDLRAMTAMEQLCEREGRWEECIEILERRALVVEQPEKRVEIMLQVGGIWENRVLDLNRAADVYGRVYGLDSSNVVASERLEAIYREQCEWEQLNEILLERVEYTDGVGERINLYGAVARVFEEELNDQESAFVVLQEAFREDYGHEDTSRELERLASAANKWQDLLQEYTERVSGLEQEDPVKACNLWVKIGRWYGEHLSNIDWAIHSVQSCLRINPDHLGALSALADFQRARGAWGELVETLNRHGAIEDDSQRKVDIYLALAKLLESELNDEHQAMAAYQAALGADSDAVDALSSLEGLYRRHEMWGELIDVLGRLAEINGEEEEVVRLKLEIGGICEQQLGDMTKAIDAYRQVLEIDSGSKSALRALEALYEKTDQSEAYLDVLEAQLDVSSSPAAQISLYERMSLAWETRFGKLDRAAGCYEKIVALDSQNILAYQQLERLYFQGQSWESLVDTYRNHILATQDQEERIQLYCSMGSVYETQLENPDRAIEAYTDVLAFDADEPRALDALGRLYERIEEWERAIDAMSQLVGSVDSAEQKTDLYYRVGRITHARLGQTEHAEQQFLYALTIDETHVPTMVELVALYSDRGDWQKAAEMKVRAAGYTQNLLERVRLLNDAAVIYLHRLDQPESAETYFAAVLALDPEHVEAGDPLATLYFKRQAWEPLEPILDMLVRKVPQRNLDSEQLMQLYYMTARTSEGVGNNERALAFYKAAYELDPTYLPVLTGRGDLLFKMGDWNGAGKIYQTILVQQRDFQDEEQVVGTYFRLGMVRQNLDERRKAVNMFEKALEIDPTHRDTLQAVISIQMEQGNFEEVVQAKRGLLATAESAEQIELFTSIADLYSDKLDNPQKAISAVVEALNRLPDDRALLQRLLELYTATEQWKNVVETIERFIELSEGVTKGSYYQAAGEICRDKLHAHEEAIEFYNHALDAFFENGSEGISPKFLQRALKPFADIDKLLTSKRDWRNQERAYRKMIKRLSYDDKLRIDLLGALGEIYRSRLKEYESAIAAYELAQQIDPKNNPRREILAELYVLAGPDQADKAIEQHTQMLKVEPFKYDSYKALRRIYMETNQYDKTWCICSTLTFLKKADETEVQFYEQYKPRGLVKAKVRMTEEIWRKVYHPDDNSYVGHIFASISEGAAMMHAKSHKSFGLRRKDRRIIESDPLQFSKVFNYAGQVLNVPMPDVYLKPDQPGEIGLANAQEKGVLMPSFVIYANFLQGRSEPEIAFGAARWLSCMRQDHYLRLALPTNSELKTAFLSAVVLVKPDFPVSQDMRLAVHQYLPEMQKRIRPQHLEQLSVVVSAFLANAPEVDLSKWGYAVDATAHRTGFMICGDLEAAARMVSREPVLVRAPKVKEKIKELVLYSISEDYFAVRSALGITIG